MDKHDYPAISDYGYISDCHSSALISKSGSIDWCCMPRVDSRSCFGRLLGWEQGGYCQIAPPEPHEVSRRYLPQTLILETTFRTSEGEARLLDCFTLREGGKQRPYRQILRVIEGLKGQVEFCVDIVPRFDYGAIKPWIQRRQDKRSGDYYIVIGGSDGLLISSDFPLEMKDRHNLQGACHIKEGQRVHLSLLYRRPEILDDNWIDVPNIDLMDQRLEETDQWWRAWSSQGNFNGPHAEQAHRSALVLKGLCNAPTGAIAAACTTSLPEAPGGERNWDYRFTWIRDSTFTVRSLADLGYIKEANGFRRFIERTVAGCAEEIQILFGVGGERRLYEHEIKELPGYRGATPVRLGNAAETQLQLDVYGELLELAWRWYQRGRVPDENYWEFLVGLVNTAAKYWRKPDQGLWEMRGAPRHFVQSKAMCWVALDRGIKLAKSLGNQAPVEWWEQERAEICHAIEEKGYDSKQGVFIQAFGHFEMDSGLLLLPIVGFVDYQDERMIRTTNAVWETLEEGGLLRRYRAENHGDGLKGKEGVFLACSFWLAECLAYQNRLEEAREVFQRAVATGNDLGLYSEEYDTETGEMLGNFPQGLTHLSLIAAAVALDEMAR